jgi:hypothetical protein
MAGEPRVGSLDGLNPKTAMSQNSRVTRLRREKCLRLSPLWDVEAVENIYRRSFDRGQITRGESRASDLIISVRSTPQPRPTLRVLRGRIIMRLCEHWRIRVVPHAESQISPVVVYCASVSPNLLSVSANVRRTAPSVSDNVRRK